MRLLNVYLVFIACAFTTADTAAWADEQERQDPIRVKLSKHIDKIEIKTRNGTVVIERTQTLTATIPPPFDRVARPCPPYCIQPITAAPGVETVGELELIAFLQKSAQSDDILIIDTRLPEWHKRATIPLAINIPYERFKKQLPHLLEKHFRAERIGQNWRFTNAKTLVLFCNGYWSPNAYQAIQQLLRLGYPADRLKWYRGGMQAWLSLGLSTQ